MQTVEKVKQQHSHLYKESNVIEVDFRAAREAASYQSYDKFAPLEQLTEKFSIKQEQMVIEVEELLRPVFKRMKATLRWNLSRYLVWCGKRFCEGSEMNQQVVADLIGTNQKQVSRIIKKLQEVGFLVNINRLYVPGVKSKAYKIVGKLQELLETLGSGNIIKPESVVINNGEAHEQYLKLIRYYYHKVGLERTVDILLEIDLQRPEFKRRSRREFTRLTRHWENWLTSKGYNLGVAA